MELKELEKRIQDTENPLPLQEVIVDLYKEMEKIKSACLMLQQQLNANKPKL